MKALALLAIFTLGCEHDPRFEKHHDEPRPGPAAAVQPPEPAPPPIINKTIERSPIVFKGPRPLKRHVHRHH